MNGAMRTESWNAVMPPAWQTFRSAPASGARNMAVDTALMETARDRAFGVWRTYAWERPTVSFGRHEAVRTRFDAASVARAGMDAVRRPTGGRALLHAAEVTYSVALPVSASVPWQVVYAAINGVLIDALRALGAPASLAGVPTGPQVRPDGPACFAQPAEGEIIVQGAKLVGSAVWRERGAYLQHGSILLEDHQDRLRDAMCGDVERPALRAPATLATVLPSPPSWTAVADALERALRSAVAARHGDVLSADVPPLDDAEVARHEVRFADPAWLWRR
jgi:lipoyl(octanoyl) transferase